MNVFRFLGLLLALALTACSSGVPTVADPHNIVVDGQKMTQAAFLEKYCAGKATDATCVAVTKAMSADSTRGAVPRF